MKANFLILLILPYSFSYGQSWKLFKTIELTEQITSVSIDPEGRIYLGLSSGNLQRLTSEGEPEEYFSDIANSQITLTEAWNKFKIFLFYRDLQKFALLDRFTTTPIEYDLSSYSMDHVWLATPGLDNSLWVLSSNYNELRKYNIQTKQLILSTPLSIDVNRAVHIRAYQNLVIISDQNQGLYLFDQFGNLLKSLEITGAGYFQVSGGKITYLKEDRILIVDPFDAAVPKKIKAPKGAFEAVLASGTIHFFIRDNQVLVYQLTL